MRRASTKASACDHGQIQTSREVSMSPFDVRSILLAKHAQHVVIVHFPIALSLMSLLFDVVAVWRRKPALEMAAHYNLIGAAISSLVAIATGLAAWQWLLEGAKLRGTLRLHLVFAVTCSGIALVVVVDALAVSARGKAAGASIFRGGHDCSGSDCPDGPPRWDRQWGGCRQPVRSRAATE